MIYFKLIFILLSFNYSILFEQTLRSAHTTAAAFPITTTIFAQPICKSWCKKDLKREPDKHGPQWQNQALALKILFASDPRNRFLHRGMGSKRVSSALWALDKLIRKPHTVPISWHQKADSMMSSYKSGLFHFMMQKWSNSSMTIWKSLRSWRQNRWACRGRAWSDGQTNFLPTRWHMTSFACKKADYLNESSFPNNTKSYLEKHPIQKMVLPGTQSVFEQIETIW